MAIQNLSSLYDLVGAMGDPESAPVANMATQTGPPWNIVGPDVVRGLYPFEIPAGSQLHGGPLENQAGRSLVGPAYYHTYGNSTSVRFPSTLDLNGVIPFATDDSITINPFGNQQLPYNQFGPPDGFY